MTYQALARKWRPRNFDQLVGQAHVRRALVNALETGRIHPAYLFTGTRGVGKTTLARLLAKCLNCERGVSATPCGECEACREIEEGRFIDLIEVDAASRTKVEDTRELLENVQYAPVRGRYKVYLIDEVHMLSGHSFNALLKTLEEPPPHIQFLLATTDPQKIPPTILSRCVQFGLKRIPEDSISEHLGLVLEREQIEGETNALHLLAVAADGSLRDALSLLDQAVAYSGGRVSEVEVREMLGTISRDEVYALLRALVRQEGSALLEVVDGLAEAVADFGSVLVELLRVLHRLAVRQVVPSSGDNDDSEIEGLALTLAPEDVQLFYQIALLGRRDLALASDPRSGFEMIMLRMLVFRPQSSDQHSAPIPSPAPAPALTQTSGRGAESGAGSAQHAGGQPPLALGTHAASGQIAKSTPPSVRATSSATAPEDWSEKVASMCLSGVAGQLASHSTLDGVDGDRYRLRIARESEHLITDRAKQRLADALQVLEGRSVRVEFRISDVVGDTPAVKHQREVEAMQANAEASIESDEAVQRLCEQFDAQVVPGSVRPRTDLDDKQP